MAIHSIELVKLAAENDAVYLKILLPILNLLTIPPLKVAGLIFATKVSDCNSKQNYSFLVYSQRHGSNIRTINKTNNLRS